MFSSLMESILMRFSPIIVKGKKTLAQVPAIIKPQVIEILKDLEIEIEE